MKTKILPPEHPEYPEAVREATGLGSWCGHAPPTLHVRGELPRAPCVSIIGSREVPPEACACARQIARRLAEAGWCVVSGGAKGIDAAAHWGALDAGRPTVAVLAGGHDQPPFPAENLELFVKIGKTGTLVTPHADGTRRRRFHFLQRNDVMVALTAATIVVHAQAGGGATKAAAAAKRLGRGVFFMPSAPWMETGSGNLRALRDGATPLWHPDDVVETLTPYFATSPTGLDEDQRALWKAAGYKPSFVDELVRRAGIGRERAAEALLMLRLDGYLEEGPPAHYRRGRGS